MLIAVNRCLPSSMVRPSMSTTVEFVDVKIKPHTCNAYIICSYIPPTPVIAIYSEHLALTKNITSRLKLGDKLILLICSMFGGFLMIALDVIFYFLT